MASVETPLALGLAVDSLWDLLPCRHVGLTWGSPQRQVKAVLVVMDQERGVFFVPSATAPGGTEVIPLNAQGEDGNDLAVTVMGCYVALDPESFEIGDLGQ